MKHSNIKWENCLGGYTNGIRAMSGKYDGLQTLIRQKALEIKHYIVLFIEFLASQNISPSLYNILETVIKVVNYINNLLKLT